MVRIPLDLTRLGAITATLVAVSYALVSELIGRDRRRVGDAGDAWRSLLFAAPPVVA